MEKPRTRSNVSVDASVHATHTLYVNKDREKEWPNPSIPKNTNEYDPKNHKDKPAENRVKTRVFSKEAKDFKLKQIATVNSELLQVENKTIELENTINQKLIKMNYKKQELAKSQSDRFLKNQIYTEIKQNPTNFMININRSQRNLNHVGSLSKSKNYYDNKNSHLTDKNQNSDYDYYNKNKNLDSLQNLLLRKNSQQSQKSRTRSRQDRESRFTSNSMQSVHSVQHKTPHENDSGHNMHPEMDNESTHNSNINMNFGYEDYPTSCMDGLHPNYPDSDYRYKDIDTQHAHTNKHQNQPQFQHQLERDDSGHSKYNASNSHKNYRLNENHLNLNNYHTTSNNYNSLKDIYDNNQLRDKYSTKHRPTLKPCKQFSKYYKHDLSFHNYNTFTNINNNKLSHIQHRHSKGQQKSESALYSEQAEYIYSQGQHQNNNKNKHPNYKHSVSLSCGGSNINPLSRVDTNTLNNFTTHNKQIHRAYVYDYYDSSPLLLNKQKEENSYINLNLPNANNNNNHNREIGQVNEGDTAYMMQMKVDVQRKDSEAVPKREILQSIWGSNTENRDGPSPFNQLETPLNDPGETVGLVNKVCNFRVTADMQGLLNDIKAKKAKIEQKQSHKNLILSYPKITGIHEQKWKLFMEKTNTNVLDYFHNKIKIQ